MLHIIPNCMNSSQIEALRMAGTADEPGPLSMVETHISWILLGENRVYKLKKPVKFDWLDATSCEARRSLCEQEKLLNSRFSPEMYLGVVPVVENQDKLTLGEGPGQVVDWAVVMQRMDTSLQLDYLLRVGKVKLAQLETLAVQLAAFHQKAERLLHPISWQETQRGFADLSTLIESLEMLPYWEALIREAIKFSADFLEEYAAWFERRGRQGFRRDVHGDLHAGNVFLLPDPVLFDCLEFSDDLRQIDVLDEVAFLTMDMESYHRPDLAEGFLESYLQVNPAMKQKEKPFYLFYQMYRANIRAKVHGLQLMQAGWNDTQRRFHLDRMERYLTVMESKVIALKQLTSVPLTW